MLDKQIARISNILKNEDLRKYAGDAFVDLVSYVLSADPVAGIKTIEDVRQLMLHFPSAIFWSKMKRFLQGTFSDYGDQVKLAEKFDRDNAKYHEFVKRLIYTIDKIDDDKKVDRFAALTRCFLLTDLEPRLFFKLSKFIIMCTPEELDFLEQNSESHMFANDPIIALANRLKRTGNATARPPLTNTVKNFAM